MQSLFNAISAAIAEATGATPKTAKIQAVSGGDINTCFRLVSDGKAYFVKSNSHPIASAMFAEEAKALTVLAENNCIKIPKPVVCGGQGSDHFLVLEFVALTGEPDWKKLGVQLAHLHRSTNTHFGWQSDNFIGTAPQQNTWMPNWFEFYWSQRLLPQLEMARNNGHNSIWSKRSSIEILCERLLANHQPRPSLVHGDLWSGNASFTENGQPIIYDPAAYFADREVDLALTQLFGGFPSDFYRGYADCWPLEPGYQQRYKLYNLYHLLNHLNLFGGGYLQQCLMTVDELDD